MEKELKIIGKFYMRNGVVIEEEVIDEIIQWFDEKYKLVNIRQAVITVDNELNGVQTKTYEYED